MVKIMNRSNDAIAKGITRVFTKIFIGTIILFVIVLASLGSLFIVNLTPVDQNDNKEVVFNLESGWSQKKTAAELKKAGLIKNDFVFLLYSRLSSKSTYLAGEYKLSKNMSVDDILNSINNGKNISQQTIMVTFVEGKRFTYFADILEDKLNISKEEVISKCADKKYLNTLIDKYWFLTDEILNSNIYYPLEGYLYPDTYEFYKDTNIEEIIEKMLDNMGTHLDPYKDKINESKYSIHSLLTLASVVELEAVTSKDRLVIAGIFYNRLNNNWTLGSDVTTYYAEQKELSEELYDSEINRCNAYNTRGTCVKGLPVGPICSPSYTSIISAIEPDNTEYFFFVADKNNKLYFAITNEEHKNNKAYLIQNNLWT